MNAGIYIRVSTAHQSTSLQRRDLEAFCERQGWTISQVYDDSGVSGTKTRRPALDQMLHDVAKTKTLDVVVVWKLDRLGRSVQHLLDVLQQLQDAGVGFVSTTQQIDTTSAMGRMVTAMLAAIASFERELIVERVKSGVARYREENPDKGWGRKRVGIDIVKALELRSQGMGYKQVAKALGVPRSTLHRTLSAIPHTPSLQAA
ncbi:MAG: recombinase family protein [Candidatus Pacebacteria bacterium]|nr:recombinase family protein [Candidatus Paceibacterota bacterium]